MRRAVLTLGEEEGTIAWNEGLELIEKHRENYGPNGPQTLVILWWEWPRRHWDELRTGASMNFVKEPSQGLTPNSTLNDETKSIAGRFADELIELQVLRRATNREVISSFPFICGRKAWTRGGISLYSGWESRGSK